MSGSTAGLMEARARAAAARAEFREALALAKDHFRPERLRDDAVAAASHKIDETRQALRQSARKHPLLLWTIVAALAVLLLRRPARLLTRNIRDFTGWIARRYTHWRKTHDR